MAVAVIDVYNEETVSWQYKSWASSSLRNVVGEERNGDVKFFEELVKKDKDDQAKLEEESWGLDDSSGQGEKQRIRYLKEVSNQCMKLQRGQAFDSSSGCESDSDSDSRWLGLFVFKSKLESALDELWGED